MHTVTVVFTNGDIVSFAAQEFDVGLDDRQDSIINRFSYKDADGEDSHVYLKPSEIAGVFLTKKPSGRDPAVTYRVPGQH